MSANNDAPDKQKGDKSQDIFPLNIKIKQEKTTSYEDSSKSETVDKLSIDVNLKNIFSTTITSCSGTEKSSEKVVDVKPAIEPLKSSNEILTELFRVFNAAPPEIIEDDSNDAVEQEKKKKKHKHKKKTKKKKGSESDSGEEEVEHPAEDGEKRVKKKKIKKEKDRDRKREKHKRSKHRIGETLLVTVKQEPVDDVDKASKQRDDEKLKENGKTKEAKPEETKQPLKSKIQIKSLKDSAIFKELATSSSQPTERHHERHHHERDKPSHHKLSRSDLRKRRTSETEFSMSDDDENKKGRYYDFYQKKYNSFYAGFEEENERKRQDRKRDRHSEDRSRRHRSNTFSRSRSRSRSRSHSTEQIDKQKLLEIARKNAINMLKKGTLPGAQNLDGESKAKLISKMHASGKSIEELTAFCKKISHKDNANDLSSVSSDESDHDADGANKAFHHPFQLKESAPIVMNIRNATTIQPKSAEEKKALLMQFPVSSGAHHRSSETEWIPVEPKKALPTTKAASTVDCGGTGGGPSFGNKTKPKPILPPSSTFVPQQSPAPDFSVPQASPLVPSIVPPPAPPAIPPLMQQHVGHMPVAPIGPPSYPSNDTVIPYHSPYLPPGNSKMPQHTHPTPSHVQPFNNVTTPDTSMNLPVDTSIPPPNMNPLGVAQHQESQQRPLFTPGLGASHPHSHLGPGSDNIFNTQSDAPIIDVSQIVSQRLNAMRRLQENPSDSDARQMLYNTQKDMSTWASSKAMPGQFLGSTGVNCLSQRELAEGYQPWASRDMMKQTAPVTGGMGMHLLQKMGWQPGEGLGKEKNGSLQPLLLDVKLDKRGLGEGENKPRLHQSYPMPPFTRRDGRPRFMNVKINTDGKHPVSILCEYATKHKWNPPMYDLVHESGPGHAKSFIFKVLVNGLEYQPAIANNTKKEAKATAAKFCLQQLGVMIT